MTKLMASGMNNSIKGISRGVKSISFLLMTSYLKEREEQSWSRKNNRQGERDRNHHKVWRMVYRVSLSFPFFFRQRDQTCSLSPLPLFSIYFASRKKHLLLQEKHPNFQEQETIIIFVVSHDPTHFAFTYFGETRVAELLLTSQEDEDLLQKFSFASDST
jgi:hypothetical protein